MPRRTKEDAEKTRVAILDAAEEVFLQTGVARTSLEMVAKAAGVTRGAVYWHFRNKSDLLAALLQRARLPVADVVAQLEDGGITAPPDSVLADVEDACVSAATLLETDERRKRVYSILLLRCEAVGDILEWRLRESRVMHARLIEAFTLAEKQNELAPPWEPRIAANATTMLMHGMFRDWLEDPERFDMQTEGIHCIRTLFNSMRMGHVGAVREERHAARA